MKKRMMSDLPKDLAEEVLCRIPLKSLKSVRSSCKKWNTLSKDRSFAKKHLRQAKAEEEKSMVVMLKDDSVSLMRFNLSNNNNNKSAESCIIREGKLIFPDGIDVCQVFHCDGLLLCVMRDNTRLVVWNPYWGQTRWIVSTHNFHIVDNYSYALGYDTSSKSHKILRYIDYIRSDFVELKIYDLNNSDDSWRVLDLPRYKWRISALQRGLTLKGNAYWFATDKEFRDSYLVCFDFTRETFGPCLPLPFDDAACISDTVSLFSVREEQLAVLFQPWDTLTMEIWITTKIEPNDVSWKSKFLLSANIRQLIGPQHQFHDAVAFFIDEEKKVAVVFDHDKDLYPTRDVAYIFGGGGADGGSLREADLGEFQNKSRIPIVCSYVPSLVQLV